MWRINFNRLVVLQDRFFNKGTNANIPYKGGPGSLPKYLQPGDVDSEGNPQNEDYSLTGIAPTDTLKWFPLCDATRRAINCLTLLYIQPTRVSCLKLSSLSKMHWPMRSTRILLQP
jgi:hypothetical protein